MEDRRALDKPTADLRNWSIRKNHLYSTYQLLGDIYNDEVARFPNGTPVTTSAIVWIDFEHGLAETRDTIYNLKD